MAFYRWLYRRKSVVVLFLTATTFWIFYLIISEPAAQEKNYINSMLPTYEEGKHLKNSVTRKVVVAPPFVPPEIQNVDNSNVIPEPPVKAETKTKEEVKQPVLEKPPDKPPAQAQEEKKIESKEKKIESDKNKDKPLNSTKGETVVNSKSANQTTKLNTTTKGPVLKEMEKKVMQIGEQLKNKTMGDWETMKNKTIEKLTDLGVIQKKKYVKLIYSPVNWDLNVTMEDIGQILKDTEFLKKRQNLTEMEYHPLMPPNSTVKMNLTDYKYGLGYCDCVEYSCQCCVRVFNKWMRVNSTACAGIIFSSKSQELQFEFSVEKKPIFQSKIAAEFPPKICLAEAKSRATGACILFSNVTSKVNIENENHKLNLAGCMEFDLTLYNKTVSAFPVGCFQIPGKNSAEKEEDRAQNVGNFMP